MYKVKIMLGLELIFFTPRRRGGPQFAGSRTRPPFGPEPDRAIGHATENASKHSPPQPLPSAVNPAVVRRSTPSPSPSPSPAPEHPIPVPSPSLRTPGPRYLRRPPLEPPACSNRRHWVGAGWRSVRARIDFFVLW